VRPLRAILLALLLSLLFGFFVGLVLRARFERPVRYIGSAVPLPLDVGHAGAAVLGPGHHEEQVG
jgi:hypothetical protein